MSDPPRRTRPRRPAAAAPRDALAGGALEITAPADRAADDLWARLSAGLSAPWLDDVGGLRADGDDLETSLDIWSVALIAALKNPARRATAAKILARLRRLSDERDAGATGETG